MNYIRELNAFYEWLESNPCSTGVVALWYTLMAINNRTGWKREFTVANMTLQAKTGMSRQQLDRCRRVLIESGRITYEKSNRANQAGKYSIVKFETQNESQNVTQNESCVSNMSHEMSHRMSHEVTTLFKQNETKQTNDLKKIEVNQILAKLFPFGLSATSLYDITEYMDKVEDLELLNIAFQIAVDKKASKKDSYVKSILQGFLNDGITTVSQYEAREAERQIAPEGESNTKHSRYSNEVHAAGQRTRSITGGRVGRV